MESFIFGCIGAIAVIFLFGIGVSCGIWYARKKSNVPVVEHEMTKDEAEQVMVERRRMVAQQKAFQAMQGYNAEHAYGIAAMESEDSDQ